jgi:hypothetical protein
MDIGRSISYITEDERWTTKLGIYTLVFLAAMFLVIPLPLLLGYQIGIMRRVMAGDKRPLPEWDDFGTLFMDGLMVMIALLVYTAPLWLLLCIGTGVSVIPAFSGGNEDVMGALVAVLLASWGVILCLLMLLSLGLFFIAPAVMVQYARTSELGSTFRLGEIMAIIRKHLVNIILVAVVNFVGNLIIQGISFAVSFTICLPFIIAPLGSVFLLAVTAHLYGQIGAMESGKSVPAY